MSGKYLQYDGETGKKRTVNGGSGGASSFSELEDVNFSDLQNGQVPKYNSTTQKWENANESGGGHTYSTTEHVIGTWIDGKPLYEKVLQNTMPTVTTDGTFVNAQIDISDTNIDYPVNFVVNMYMSSQGQYYILPYLNNSGRIAKAFVTSNSRDKLITLVSNGTAFSELSVKIILQYTKTTD